MGTFTSLICLLLISSINGYVLEEQKTGSNYAVLVAGSNTWMNYRHQSDVCHAYQILKQHGFDEENIIVMMYDDIANNPENKYKGKIINRPDGPNVYEGVKIDYKGKDVTPANFLKLLSGQNMTGIGSGRTLKSGPNDRVFINLVDHGAPGIFGFPTNFLHASDFLTTLKSMHQNKQYKEMVIYVESCESGSMFEHLLPTDINIYAITASNSKLSSYACYFDKDIGVFLGDVFSIKWMEDTDRENLKKETLFKQYEIVKNETKTSPVQRFGEIKISKEHLSEYFGTKSSPHENVQIDSGCDSSAVKSSDVPVAVLEKKMNMAKTVEEKQIASDMYVRLHQNREFVRDVVKKISLSLTKNAEFTERITHEDHVTEITDWDCYEHSVDAFHDKCFNLGLNTYALRHVKVFNSLCEHGFTYEEIIEQIHMNCKHPETINIH